MQKKSSLFTLTIIGLLLGMNSCTKKDATPAIGPTLPGTWEGYSEEDNHYTNNQKDQSENYPIPSGAYITEFKDSLRFTHIKYKNEHQVDTTENDTVKYILKGSLIIEQNIHNAAIKDTVYFSFSGQDLVLKSEYQLSHSEKEEVIYKLKKK